MSVLIEGMEMPRTCYDCKFRKRNGLELICPVLERSYKIADTQVLFFREKDCPLIEVHEPHGRLINADALDVVLKNEAKSLDVNVYACGIADGLSLARSCIETASTVIPASMEG